MATDADGNWAPDEAPAPPAAPTDIGGLYKSVGQDASQFEPAWAKSGLSQDQLFKGAENYFSNITNPVGNAQWWGQDAWARVPLQGYAGIDPSFNWQQYTNPQEEAQQQQAVAQRQEGMKQQNNNGGLDPAFWASLGLITGGGLGAFGAFGGAAAGGAEAGAAGAFELPTSELWAAPGSEAGVGNALGIAVPGGTGAALGTAAAAAGEVETAGGGPQFLDATTPTMNLSPEVMQQLGIAPQGFEPGFALPEMAASGAGIAPEMMQLLNLGGGFESGFALPEVGSTGAGFLPGAAEAGFSGAGAESGFAGNAGAGMSVDGAFDPSSFATQALQQLKKLGLSPATLAQLGISGINALRTPKLPGAAKSLQDQATPGAAQAQAVIQSGGQGSPAWAAQKSSIDATIDQQMQEQMQAILQQAQNSGMGPDSNVTVQQMNKAKTQLETQRQTLYAQAQGQNVQAALSSLGIQDQALAQVANAQFKSSEEAKANASATAQNALMLQALSRGAQQPAPA